MPASSSQPFLRDLDKKPRATAARPAALESALRDSIALVKERRSTLINAAVTGRIQHATLPA